MLAYCVERQGEVEGVVVYSVDRFSRNVEDFITLGGDLRKTGYGYFWQHRRSMTLLRASCI